MFSAIWMARYGKTKDNEDITVAVNGYKPPVKAIAEAPRNTQTPES
ncbi:MAG: hypothetical protein U0Z17_02940 [Bacteroidales bacterium]